VDDHSCLTLEAQTGGKKLQTERLGCGVALLVSSLTRIIYQESRPSEAQEKRVPAGSANESETWI
jgi:hypothetical protein